MTQHPLIFLIGLHGVGKSTIGKHLAAEHKYRHLSIGDIGRLVRKRKMPAGYSARFLLLLAGHEPGERMSPRLVEALHAEIARQNAFGPLVVDGFPAEPYHVMDLPTGSTVIRLSCDEDERMKRLTHRSETTARKWNHETIDSRRDRQIEAVFEVAMERKEIHVAEIQANPSPAEIATKIQECVEFFSGIR